ncbi:MAG: 2OG-Fe(II) oxygenase, partial [Actinomycetota bacterium]|nr:2OG-Fe(II) oxygenase [Actinomycetota bacterium]
MFLRPEITTTAAAEKLGPSFAAALPFPHVVLDDVLAAPPAELLAKFPAPEWPSWHRYLDAYQRAKLICSDIAAIPEPFAQLIEELSRPAFLTFLEMLTGIPKLLVDPYLEGGGLHCSGPGGILAPHTDFHLYPRLGIYRRVNVLLYLNEEWDQSCGGCLELYQPQVDQPVRTVVPGWGTCVIFRTDDRSPHGFS